MRTKSLALSLAAFLLLGTFSAVPAAAEPRGADLNGFWVQLSSLFASFWSDASGLTDHLGCAVEPNGSCSPTSGPTANLGCALEPYGGCRAGAGDLDQVDAGCIADPDGRCRG